MKYRLRTIAKSRTSCMMLCTLATLFLSSCENGDIEFDDYDYQTVYFANQTPVRTITLGDDVYDTTLDNEHRFEIYVTLGGVWKNREARTVTVQVDESLCDGLYFDDGDEVLAMPSSYYSLSGNTITIEEGEVMGCVVVQLNDAFFYDTKSIDINYVVPMRIVGSADSILADKDYTLYAVKYKNKWDGCWLCRGTDVIDLNGVQSTESRMTEYIEDNDLVYLTTTGYTECCYPISTTVAANSTIETLSCDLILSFDADDNCTVTTTTDGCTATGSGSWTRQGAEKAWGDKDRDQLILSYTVTYNYTDDGVACYKTIEVADTLVMRDRQSKFETFSLSE